MTQPERLSTSRRGYDRRWQRCRAAFLRVHPLCTTCFAQGKITAATVVDHKLTIAERPDLRLDWDNLRPLCKPCHDRHTATEQGWNRSRTGTRLNVTSDGTPVSPKHPWSREP